ncbi:MAG: hypothetical protein BROFUL_01722 [Candidatus Brocadia fulgida]|uniref:Uncharacterized protein n=1 Tax=Candidatus Brocadia fulgida TaxID=380242 RepID=A0A0M2UX50_9BACT|nr:MAG: hypothetical protein BROFUL_01722 [Candidatus Brocadia fulgida]
MPAPSNNTDASNSQNHTGKFNKKQMLLILFNVCLSIGLSIVLVWLVAYTPVKPEKEFHVKLFEFLKDAPYNTSQSKKEFKNNLLTFLKTNRYEPFRSEKKFFHKPLSGGTVFYE